MLSWTFQMEKAMIKGDIQAEVMKENVNTFQPHLHNLLISSKEIEIYQGIRCWECEALQRQKRQL